MANKKIPMRQCVGCGEMKAKKELLRVLKTEDGVLLDATGKKNGRGAYICANTECLKKARKSKGLERSLKVAIPDEVYDNLEKEMSTFA
ncbi:MAG: YlxR family protein [Lachnobacterium sp.]|nr:YlxR family protein [Lachnobacterium sp.]MCI7086935.1 YlxR family protein [Lachnobacterium sp.]MCI7531625.1 YlxR family protein [Lachnobacterium sp.]MDD7713150.1 YlxR family protein [Lachnobacterium sp.]MDY5461164.1 YlxR family protein [Agathobacter sp.]